MIGIMIVGLALSPKLMAPLLMIPDAVASAFMLGIMGLLFVEGMRTVVADSFNPRKTLVVGFSLAIGVGLQGPRCPRRPHRWGMGNLARQRYNGRHDHRHPS